MRALSSRVMHELACSVVLVDGSRRLCQFMYATNYQTRNRHHA
jgi:hypothetical protein